MKYFVDKQANEQYAEDYGKAAKQIRDGTYEFCDWLEKQGAKFIGITNDGLTYTTDDKQFQKLLNLFGFRRQNGTVQKAKGKQCFRGSNERTD